MKLKKIIVILAIVSIFILSLGFGANAKTFRVAVIMPSSISDLAFSQSMYDALLTSPAYYSRRDRQGEF
jgi:basic membrane protein A